MNVFHVYFLEYQSAADAVRVSNDFLNYVAPFIQPMQFYGPAVNAIGPAPHSVYQVS
jgi:hypothetical protein